ncbi:hypothetical protein QR680_008507 [Steinernema hermaphroditum]|uniref:Serpentine receptor class gamma n=1 Tax=Steinernema hermaphroditum TaxID=289476 RepID=A0AA39IGW5_9BILA|nr:hypothetical protein QR680_008507 [Steinernema hermaphroditum]
MNTEIIMLVLSLLYGIPSFVLYVVILIQLIRPKHHKRFSNPFFRLCFLIGIVDCIGYLNFYFFVRLPTYAFLSFVYTSPLFNSSPLTTAMYFLIYFCSNLQLFGNCFLTFNRFTSILVRPKHKKRFDNPFYRLCFLIGVVDCLGYIHYFVFFVLPMYSFISPLYASSLFASSPFTTAIYFSNYVFGYLQLFGNCFLTFNRFTSISPLRNPSFLLYIVILFQLIRPKCQNRFGNPFYRLCFLIGIVDCVGYLDFYIFITLPTYSLFVSFYRSSLFSPSAFTTAVYFSNYVFGYLQLFGNCFLTFNRFTCVVFPTNHAKIWRYCFPFSIERLLQVLIYIALETNNDMMITMLFTLLPWLSDFKYLSPPWVLIFISTSIRQTVVQLLPKRLVHYAKHSLLATSTATITTVNVKPLNGG